MATISKEQPRGHHDRNQRWARFERADLCKRYGELHIQGVSQRQVAQGLDVPRRTLPVPGMRYVMHRIPFDRDAILLIPPEARLEHHPALPK